ncbi:MAG TPA: hypothetical protein DHV48_18225 [Prolixibacteraceae bacterium]|nr:hypothetical protein [Prolixibacteraceae bacterium]
MLILLKQSIKTSFILLLFMFGGTNLNAGNLLFYKLQGNNLNTSALKYPTENDTIKANEIQNELFTIPKRLEKTQISFRINSDINYLSFDHFIRNDAKKMFFQAWLKEKELERLSVKTDSLRHAYTAAESEKKEEISSQILQSEKKLIQLNQEIPALYENARNEEDNYWRSASSTEISGFQEKIKEYADSLQQIATTKNEQKSAVNPEVKDTIVLYSPAPQVAETKAEDPLGIVYKIQIGAFKGKIPDTANKLITKLSMIRKIDKHIDSKGVTIYTTGNLKSYQEAVTLQNQIKQEGAKNPTITAYKDGKKVQVDVKPENKK